METFAGVALPIWLLGVGIVIAVLEWSRTPKPHTERPPVLAARP
jgi:divalent metal cation (Fe/Co/Zn/Cd) transporter